jgi:hypothetical protein
VKTPSFLTNSGYPGSVASTSTFERCHIPYCGVERGVECGVDFKFRPDWIALDYFIKQFLVFVGTSFRNRIAQIHGQPRFYCKTGPFFAFFDFKVKNGKK